MLDQSTHAEPARPSLPVNPFNPDKYIAIVSRASGSQLEITFPNIHDPSSADIVSRAEVGGYVLVGSGEHAVLGQLSEMWIPDGSNFDSSSSIHPIGRVQLSSSIHVPSGKVIPGTGTMPRIGDKVFVADAILVQMIVEAKQRNKKSGQSVTMQFAHLPDGAQTSLHFTPEMLFGRHCALLGTTGGGKSWSLARIVEEASKLKSKTILFDATGEFYGLSGPIRHVYLGSDPQPKEGAVEVALPYYELTERDLFAIFRPKGQSQAPKLRAAIKSLKLLGLAPELSMDSTLIKAHRSKKDFLAASRRFHRELENPLAMFDIECLARQIENECVRPNRSALEPMFWGDTSGTDLALCTSLVNRVSDMVTSPSLSAIFAPHGKPSLIKEIDDFLQDPSLTVLCISLKHLPFSHLAREIVANAMGRHLLALGRKEHFRERPLLVVLDEAHQFLNRELVDRSAEYPLDSFSIIAKEGRKYSLSICLATQRPRDLPEGVLSQMGTLIVHRLINDMDRGVIERASGEMDKTSLNAIPGLAPGHAVIMGVSFPTPVTIKVEPPSCPPDSDGPDYQRYWRKL